MAAQFKAVIAGNEEEVRSIARRFMPSPLDTKKSAADKLDRLEEYMRGTLDLSGVPSGDDGTTGRKANAGTGEDLSRKLRYTAKKHGISVEEVKRRMREEK